MGVEIERKYLVKDDRWRHCEGTHTRMDQWYLNEEKSTIRVRIAGEKAYLTIKSKTVGISRMEFEYEIPVEDAKQMMVLTKTPIVSKIRHKIPFEGHDWEVDEFLGENEGLTVAEIEVKSEDETYQIPDWIGEDVSADKRYRNTHLASHPYKYWEK